MAGEPLEGPYAKGSYKLLEAGMVRGEGSLCAYVGNKPFIGGFFGSCPRPRNGGHETLAIQDNYLMFFL